MPPFPQFELPNETEKKNIRKNVLMVPTVQQLDRLPQKEVNSASLEVFKQRLASHQLKKL